MRLAESLVQARMAIGSSSASLLVCQLSESLFRLLYYTKGNQETFKMVSYKIYKLKSMHTLVYHKLGGVTIHLGFNDFKKSFKNILDISDDGY
jgi:hypothetical protein